MYMATHIRCPIEENNKMQWWNFNSHQKTSNVNALQVGKYHMFQLLKHWTDMNWNLGERFLSAWVLLKGRCQLLTSTLCFPSSGFYCNFRIRLKLCCKILLKYCILSYDSRKIWFYFHKLIVLLYMWCSLIIMFRINSI